MSKEAMKLALKAADELEWMLKSGYEQGREGPPRVHRLIGKIKALAEQPAQQQPAPANLWLYWKVDDKSVVTGPFKTHSKDEAYGLDCIDQTPLTVAAPQPAQQWTDEAAKVPDNLWDGGCVLGHCGSPTGCELSDRCRADCTSPQAQPAQQQPVTVLPDGSAFAVMSYPLPKDHWLYADRQYNDGEYEPVELGKPVLTHELRDAVVSAVRYAIRGATNCGKEVDFDPDALVQNAVYALCGPFTSPPAQQEPVAYAVYHRMGGSKSLHWPEQHSPDGDASQYQLVPLYTTPPAQRKPLTDERPAQQALDKMAENARELGLDYEPVWDNLPSNKDVEDAMRMKRLNQLATPPAAQRQWVGLTQQDIDIAFDDTQEGGGFNEFARAIEAKLREKNT